MPPGQARRTSPSPRQLSVVTARAAPVAPAATAEGNAIAPGQHSQGGTESYGGKFSGTRLAPRSPIHTHFGGRRSARHCEWLVPAHARAMPLDGTASPIKRSYARGLSDRRDLG